MKMKTNLLAATIAAVGLSSISAHADAVTEAFKAGETTISFRARSETVDQDVATDESATANTLKTRLTYKSGAVAGFSVVAEVDNVSALTETDYNDKSPTSSQNSGRVIADHEYTDVNQAYIQYSGFDSVVKVGNQRILLDNQRHVGGVGWRQDEATFDAVSVTNKSIADTTIFAAAINNRHTIFGTETLEDIELLNVNYKMGKVLSATGYAYLISNTALTVGGAKVPGDVATYGVRATGATGPALYEVEYATQTQEADAGGEADVTYYNVAAGAKVAGITAKLGQEYMGSDEVSTGVFSAFSTPLGTNHKFNGWADAFLGGIPNVGTVDTYATVATKVAGVKLVGQYHAYETDEGSVDAGSEIGFLAAKKFGNYGASLKAAQYTASDDIGTDTTKVWLTGTAKF